MRKRRLVIVSFLLCSTLIMGIGFAAIAGELKITGSAIYRPTSVVQKVVDGAILFDIETATPGENCTCASVSRDRNTAKMVAVFNDVGDGIETFRATADFTITYKAPGQNDSYPTVWVSFDPRMTDRGFMSDWKVNGIERAQAVKLSPGDTITVTVIATFTPYVGVPAEGVEGELTIKIDYSFIDPTVNS